MLVMLALAAVAVIRRRKPSADEWGTGWMWPVPDIVGPNGVKYAAVITDGIDSPRGNGLVHNGVDIAFKRRDRADLVDVYKPRTAAGTLGAFAPRGTPIVAARDGRIWSVERTPRGIAVVLDHGKPWATFYQHLATTMYPEHTRGKSLVTGGATYVKAGDILGTMGGDPLDPQGFRHLHFATWFGGTDNNAVDPAAVMRTWARVPWRWPAPEGK